MFPHNLNVIHNLNVKLKVYNVIMIGNITIMHFIFFANNMDGISFFMSTHLIAKWKGRA